MIQVNLFTNQNQVLQISKANLCLLKGKHERMLNQELGINMYTLYKIDNQQESSV